MSDPSSQPTQPLTDEQRFELWRAFAGGDTPQYFAGFQDQHWTAGVDRLAAALAPMLDGEYERLRVENIRLRAENTAQGAKLAEAEYLADGWSRAGNGWSSVNMLSAERFKVLRECGVTGCTNCDPVYRWIQDTDPDPAPPPGGGDRLPNSTYNRKATT